MKVDVKKVRSKIIDLAVECIVSVKSISRSNCRDKEFTIMLNKCVCAEFLLKVAEEFKDERVVVYGEGRNVLVILDINNLDYWL